MTSVDLTPLRAQVEILRWACLRKKELKELEDAARADIEAAMGDAETGLVDGEPVIRWASHKRTSLDQSWLKSDNPTLCAEYMRTTEVRKFEVLDA